MLGEYGLLWHGIALAGAALDEKRRGQWLRASATVVGAFGVNTVIKLAVLRTRPRVEGLPPLINTMTQMSYPSAHATTSAAAARALAPLVSPAIYPLAVAMALSRLYLGVHWPSDTLAGLALGTAVGELAS
jgi:membrane-associated phospholipid phosphatase